jgi:methyltransferase (TIGR00027 family)
MDPVAQTSLWMAAARARESERPYRLFDDPLASALAGPEGFSWLDRMKPVPNFGGPALYVVVRTRFFDDFLRYASWGAGLRQVVILAAGMDTRAYRLDWPPGTRLYEVDRPEVLAAKDEVLARAGTRPACERHTLGADLSDPSWAEALIDAGYEDWEPSVWLVEGLLFYLAGDAVRKLLGIAATLTVPRSLLGLDLVNRDLLNAPTMRPLLAAFAQRGASGSFGVNNPEALLGEYSWNAEVTQSGEWAANYGRWAYPVALRGIPNLPRIFFVRAWRSGS